MPNRNTSYIRFASYAELLRATALAEEQTDGSILVPIGEAMLVDTDTQRSRLEFFDTEIAFDGKPLSLPAKQHLALFCFRGATKVAEDVLASAAYRNSLCSHRAIRMLLRRIEEALDGQVYFEFDHGYWEIFVEAAADEPDFE